jgi:hypothetical protein
VIGLPRRRLLVYQYRLGPNWLDFLDALAATTLHQYNIAIRPCGGRRTVSALEDDAVETRGDKVGPRKAG